MASISIVCSPAKTFEEIDSLLAESKSFDAIEENQPVCSNAIKRFFVGAACVLTMSTAPSLPIMQNGILEPSSIEFMLGELEATHRLFSDIEQEIAMISEMRIPIDELIDADEIRNEVEIISTYMQKMKTIYAMRKKSLTL
jgi:hypothetical protein